MHVDALIWQPSPTVRPQLASSTQKWPTKTWSPTLQRCGANTAVALLTRVWARNSPSPRTNPHTMRGPSARDNNIFSGCHNRRNRLAFMPQRFQLGPGTYPAT